MKSIHEAQLERLCWENAERRRFAELVNAREEREAMEELAARRRGTELKIWRRWGRVSRIAAQVHLTLGAVFGLTGLPGLTAMCLISAMFFYTVAALSGAMSRELEGGTDRGGGPVQE